MDKKKLPFWGVSLFSFALIAGMLSYLGFVNNETSNKLNTNQTVNSQSETANDWSQNINNPYNHDGTLTILSGDKEEQQKPFTDDGD